MATTAVRPRDRATTGHTPTALALGCLMGFRYPVLLDIPVGILAAAALLPVTLVGWRRYRGATTLTVLAALAALSGLFLSLMAPGQGGVGLALLVSQTGRVVLLGAGLLVLLWVRSVVGTRLTVLCYGTGSLLTVVLGIAAVNPDNPWKFTYSVPVILLLLGQRWIFERTAVEPLVLLGLAGVSVLNDSRSAAAMLIISSAAVLTLKARRGHPRSALLVAAGIALIGIAGFYAVQAAILQGALGEATKERTVEQTRVAGNVILGGRPEGGAAVALVARQPFGYGAGALASPADLATAKQGMARLGYDPDNGYVEKYMLGHGFEVHSLLGDLSISYGLAGTALALAILVVVGWGLVHGLARNAASGVMLFLSIRTMWDFAFSPFPTVMTTLMLALAVAMPERPPREAVTVDVPPRRRVYGRDRRRTTIASTGREVPTGGR